MGRPRSLSAKRNFLMVRLSDKEMTYVEELAKTLGKGKSTIVRELLDLLFEIDPEKLKADWDKLRLDF